MSAPRTKTSTGGGLYLDVLRVYLSFLEGLVGDPVLSAGDCDVSAAHEEVGRLVDVNVGVELLVLGVGRSLRGMEAGGEQGDEECDTGFGCGCSPESGKEDGGGGGWLP
jgi:hypothetical protein